MTLEQLIDGFSYSFKNVQHSRADETLLRGVFMGIEPAAGDGLIIQVRLYFITEAHTQMSPLTFSERSPPVGGSC